MTLVGAQPTTLTTDHNPQPFRHPRAGQLLEGTTVGAIIPENVRRGYHDFQSIGVTQRVVTPIDWKQRNPRMAALLLRVGISGQPIIVEHHTLDATLISLATMREFAARATQLPA